MPRPLRIAILECDTPIGRAREKYGGYGNLFRELLTTAAERLRTEENGLDLQLEVTKFDVVNAEVYPKLENVDVVLLTGSKYNSFDNDPWILKLVAFTQEVLEEGSGVRLIGVCFGHQILGRALDVPVGRNEKGWEVAVTNINLTPKGKELFGVDGELAIHQMHRDIVHSLPPGVESLGFTDVCAVQGMYSKGRLISVQGHPEFYAGIMEDLINTRHQTGVFDDELAADARTRMGMRHDGVRVAMAFLRFCVE